ncbi:helix-turn-helix domain-containing protein [Streptacidiphilus anmyonensis]|uniref:helix-turn-helix domain-containing protein n=1 Tax=Streptacidiphilus anmyonensis TaxID=405782 RepID=UPI001364A50F|nr:tetratricopeptide repeat protein [Streptacidiphilus anmyonensis]
MTQINGSVLGPVIKKARKGRGLTQKGLADLLNQASGWGTCTANDVYRWETNRRTPGPWLPFLIEVLCLEPFIEPEPISGRLPTLPQGAVDPSRLPMEDDVRRRSFLGAVIAGAAPLFDLAALEHLTAAVRNAHRYADHELVGHLRAALDETACMDVRRGSLRAMPAALGILSAISIAAREAKPAVRRELLVLGSRAAEFTAWLHHDVGSSGHTVGYWHGQAKEWATFTGDGAMHAYVLMRQAQALGRNDPARMLDLAAAATSGPWTLPLRPRAEALQQEARGLAMTGADADEVARVLDRAHAALDRAEAPVGPASCTGPLGDGYTRERLLVQSAIRLREAGRPVEAVAAFQAHLTTDAFAPRDHALYSAFLAGSLADIGEPDEAAAVALQALEIAAEVRSGQAISALNGAARTLFPYRQRPQVRELHERLVVLAAD